MIKNIIFTVLLVLSLVGCNDSHTKNLDGEKLLKQKCSSCHNIDMPPKTYENEVAPPMMAVAFHVPDFIQTNDESSKIPKAIDFVKDYVINPSAKKSLCDKKSLKAYGVMPSQKGKVSEDELEAIATYMFKHFTAQNLAKEQARINKLRAMSKGQKIAIANKCLVCHKANIDTVGPSFKHIFNRYKNNDIQIIKSIKNGSTNNWEMSKGRVMPSFKNINNENIKELLKWLKKGNNIN